MFKRLSLAAAVLAGTTALAPAADLPLRSAPPAFVPPPPLFTWTGFYLGVNAGYDFSNDSRFRQLNGTVPPAQSGIGTTRPGRVGISDDGFSAGGQIGYNYQFGGGGGGPGFLGLGAASVVLGLEADAAYTDIDKSVAVTGFNGAGVAAVNTFRADLDYLGTVRGRLGLAFDRVLVYATGGLAYGNVQNSVNFYNAGTGTASLRFRGTRDSVETGYTVGGGIEYAVPTDSFLNSLNFFHSSAVTIKAEYLYYNLGDRLVNLPATPGGGGANIYQSRVSTDGNLVRMGLNYKF